MARLTEEMVIARSKQSDLSAIKKLNCWGAELGDVSLLRRMPNVEVLALSINKIRSLDDFSSCRCLRELYVRKNEIRDLSEIRHLRRLPALTSLWLEENPCTQHPQYRMTVLRNLPRLEKLDNVPVNPDEVQEAMRRGLHIPDSDDEGYPPQQDQYTECRSVRSSPSPEPALLRRHEGSDSSEPPPEPPEPVAEENHQAASPPARRSPPRVRRETPMTRSHYERSPRAPSPEPGALRHSVSAISVKEYSYSADGERGVTSPLYSETYERPHDRCESYQQLPRCAEWERDNSARERERDREWERDGTNSTRDRDSREWEREGNSAREREGYTSAVMAEHRGFTRRPVTRNSNLLSAVLCLVKELDYPSLEVAEMAVRCRMDELANSQ
ncbi:zinc finger CCCH domain-containing protein 13 isoform X1 [Plutella xylostella]|uniref:zinc finger CCCH domain-containing protein 13 isoform X1 n=1 Tax=Plutella xylostella TaxID=51655 RepID=UPI0020329D2B|nr:zinc finger CCCH domain-containing protein 13 isoform X1 [Plutella xylostella]